MIELRERIVEELIYERVLLDAELLELIELERDMSESLRRAIAEAAGEPAAALALADRCIERVFRRMAAEALVELGCESEVTEDGEDDGDCPLCEAPLVCPPRQRSGDRARER